MSKKNMHRRFKKQLFKNGNTIYCAWCFIPLLLETATLDHNIALADGGSDRKSNWLIACYPCNQMRGKETYKRRSPPRPCFQCAQYHKGKCPLSSRKEIEC